MKDSRCLKDLKILRNKGNVALILRHAEKQVKSKISDERSISLTKKGRLEAEKLGRTLIDFGYNIDLLKSSPLGRCVETCEAIARGGKFKLDIILSNNLGDPGPFIYNNKLAGKNFLDYSVEEVVHRQLNGEIMPGMRHVEQGVKILYEEIMEDMGDFKGLGVYVTHDAILAPFMGYLTGIPITKENWFGFLDSIFLSNDNGIVSLLWNGNTFNID